MPPPTSSPPPASDAFIDAFRTRAGAAGVLRFDAFMDLALYHPALGYYRRDRPRVGRRATTDFYTATSSGAVFGELVAAACVRLLDDQDPRAFTFVEIGAEPEGGVLKNVTHPFRASKTLRLGEPLTLEGPLVVFSNELFDAQPIRRFVTREGVWRELGVNLSANGQLCEIELPPVSVIAGSSVAPLDLPAGIVLPAPTIEGYHLDLPIAAVSLADSLAAQPWTGLFVAFDYGKSWRELTEATPQGTARAYHQHTQSNDLLVRPGEQDLTSHVCWDWLAEVLTRRGFASPALESQESFFIHHAGEFIATTIAAEATRLSPRKLSLMQLLHPVNMGQKFQVLHALRR
jgi:SAM-dependent MidA family methyltransferase